jgi:acyl-CoA oxidase
LAGVNSGLVVETTAEFVNGEFVINTPTAGAAKNWISQGLVADDAVVIANLTVNGKSYGPQAFMVQLRDANSGELLPGVTAVDMGEKTVGNDLDNARLTFKNFRVKRETLLCRYLTVDGNGNVSQPSGNKKSMEMIGQRLFTGRVAVAQTALSFAESVFTRTKQFADKKACWSPDPSRRPPLSEVPQIRAIFAEGFTNLKRLERFMSRIESELSACLRTDRIPPVKLQQAIAVGKVKSVETAISLCFALKQEVGSYALMASAGFGQLDFLQCCKFAEGDSRILMQKMARDIARAGPANEAEKQALQSLQSAMGRALKQGAAKDKAAAWDVAWRDVYALAEAHMGEILKQYGAAPVAIDTSSSGNKISSRL